MKTDATKKIERALLSYDPVYFEGIKTNKFRPRHTFFEFPVECGTTLSGLVDAIKIVEYFGDLQSYKSCRWFGWDRGVPVDCKRYTQGDAAPDKCEDKECIWVVNSTVGVPKILFVAYEIKISRPDFLSQNGHNFCGNLNYYVMPNEIWSKCKKDIPDGIGVISVSQGQYGYSLRRVKASCFRQLTDEQQKWFLLTALKK